MHFSYQENRSRLITCTYKSKWGGKNTKLKLRHEEKVSDKASAEFRAHFKEKKVQKNTNTKKRFNYQD